MKRTKKESKPKDKSIFVSPVGIQLRIIPDDRSTVVLIAKIMADIPDDVSDDFLGVLAMRTMKRHLEYVLSKVDTILGPEAAAHTLTHIPKDREDVH